MRASVVVVCSVLAALGCATTEVTSQSPSFGSGPRPDRILVYAFATSPEDVRLDHSLTAQTWKLQGISASTERRQVGQAVADALADNLVKKFHAMGLPAERAFEPAPRDGVTTVVIEGQFLAINEGSRMERVVIGLGAGKSDVRTAVQAIEIMPEGSRLLDTFEIDAKSDSTPGMAETMGAGAAAGHLAASAAVSVVKAGADEEFGADVEADAARTAEKIAKVMGDFFASQGWIAQPAD